jgi:DNA-binding GntR family transcriptional regulator
MTRLAKEGGLDLSVTRMYSVPRLTADDYLEATAIRLALEPMAAELAVSRLTSDNLAQLAEINAAMRREIEAEHYQDGLILDSRFHLGIYSSCGLPLLWQIIASLWLRIGPTRNQLSPAYRRGLRGYRLHLKILGALERTDGPAAARLIRRDLGDGAAHLAKVLSSS